MKAKDLIEKLQKLDPEEEIYMADSEYGVETVDDFSEYETHVTVKDTETGLMTMAWRKVWTLFP